MKKFLVLSVLVLMTICVYGQKAVDLGLSVKWADCNVGASSPQQVGNYYAWGETRTKEIYTWETYSLGNDVSTCRNIGENICGTKYDAARQNIGEGWRMPTAKEMEELVTRCHWTWITLNGVKGYNVEGPNGNSIFLPAAGFRSNGVIKCVGEYGRYWANSAHQNLPQAAYFIGFTPEEVELSANERFYGHTIRPVTP